MDGSMDRVQTRSTDQLETLRTKLEQQRLPQRMERVTLLLEDLDQSLDLLGRVLHPVLAPQGSQQLTPVEEDPTTELAAFLQAVAGRLDRAVAAVRDLTDRVDL